MPLPPPRSSDSVLMPPPRPVPPPMSYCNYEAESEEEEEGSEEVSGESADRFDEDEDMRSMRRRKDDGAVEVTFPTATFFMTEDQQLPRQSMSEEEEESQEAEEASRAASEASEAASEASEASRAASEAASRAASDEDTEGGGSGMLDFAEVAAQAVRGLSSSSSMSELSASSSPDASDDEEAAARRAVRASLQAEKLASLRAYERERRRAEEAARLRAEEERRLRAEEMRRRRAEEAERRRADEAERKRLAEMEQMRQADLAAARAREAERQRAAQAAARAAEEAARAERRRLRRLARGPRVRDGDEAGAETDGSESSEDSWKTEWDSDAERTFRKQQETARKLAEKPWLPFIDEEEENKPPPGWDRNEIFADPEAVDELERQWALEPPDAPGMLGGRPVIPHRDLSTRRPRRTVRRPRGIAEGGGEDVWTESDDSDWEPGQLLLAQIRDDEEKQAREEEEMQELADTLMPEGATAEMARIVRPTAPMTRHEVYDALWAHLDPPKPPSPPPLWTDRPSEPQVGMPYAVPALANLCPYQYNSPAGPDPFETAGDLDCVPVQENEVAPPLPDANVPEELVGLEPEFAVGDAAKEAVWLRQYMDRYDLERLKAGYINPHVGDVLLVKHLLPVLYHSIHDVRYRIVTEQLLQVAIEENDPPGEIAEMRSSLHKVVKRLKASRKLRKELAAKVPPPLPPVLTKPRLAAPSATGHRFTFPLALSDCPANADRGAWALMVASMERRCVPEGHPVFLALPREPPHMTRDQPNYWAPKLMSWHRAHELTPTPYGWMAVRFFTPPPPRDWILHHGRFVPPQGWHPRPCAPLDNWTDIEDLAPLYESAEPWTPEQRAVHLPRCRYNDTFNWGYSCPMLWCVTVEEWWYVESLLQIFDEGFEDLPEMKPIVEAVRRCLLKQLEDPNGEPYRAYRTYRLARLRHIRAQAEQELEKVRRHEQHVSYTDWLAAQIQADHDRAAREIRHNQGM
jgi:hypothetical protein